MRKILYSILGIGLFMASCTNFDDPVTENYGDGPAVSIDVTATTDSTFTFTVSPASGAQYYSYIVVKANSPQELSGATLLKGGYSGGIAGEVVSAEKDATITNNMRVKGAPLCVPNTTYQIYAVAANDKGITGAVANVSVTTTDGNAPTAKTFKPDTKAKAAAITFSEAVARSNGAIVAQYYKEWDINNAVTLTEEEYTVSIEGSVVTFSAPKAPAGSILTFSWESGAFVDSFGNKCTAMDSGINVNTGKFKGVYIATDKENFAVADTCFTAPKVGTSFGDWTQFKGEITFEFDVYRNDNTVKAGDLKVVYSNDNKTTAINLDATHWMIEKNKLYFVLPEAPQFGDYIGLQMTEGAITDVYGNPNSAYEIEKAWLRSYGYKRELVIGTYTMNYTSYFDGTSLSETITTKADADSKDGVIISGLAEGLGISGEVKGTFSGDYATITVASGQPLEENDSHAVYLMNGGGGETITYNVAANGNLSTSDLWGYYIVKSDGSEGFLEAAEGAALIKATAPKAVAKTGAMKINISEAKLRTLNFK